MPFNYRKAIEAILLFAEKEKNAYSRDIDFIKINKYCYFSEQQHLKAYLKPIFGDTYCALPEGPVPSVIYDILKAVRGDSNPFMESMLVLESGQAPFKVYDRFRVVPLRPSNTKVFSESDLEVMESVFKRYSAYESFALSEISHGEPAWKNAFQNCVNEMNFEEIIGDKEAWAYISQKEQEAQLIRAAFQP